MGQQVPQGFRITESAWAVIRSLVEPPHHLAWVCWTASRHKQSGEVTEGWTVFSHEERECDNPVEWEGVRFVFDEIRRDELIGKALDWTDEYRADGNGFRLV